MPGEKDSSIVLFDERCFDGSLVKQKKKGKNSRGYMKIYVHVNICVFLRLRWVFPSVFFCAILRERMVNIHMETKTLF